MNRRASPLALLALMLGASCAGSRPASPAPSARTTGPVAAKAGATPQDDGPFFEEVIWVDDDQGGYVPWPRNDNDEVAFSFGGAYWNKLEGLDPDIPFPTSDGFGSLQSWGFGVDLSYHHRVVQSKRSSLWLGGRLGLQSWGERSRFFTRLPNGEVIDDDVSATTTQAVISARLEQDLGPFSVFVGGGGGFYHLQIEEEDDRGWGGRSDELADDSSLGGFVSLGLDFELGPFNALRLENVTHFVHFDSLDEFTPGKDTIEGPINVAMLGFVGRF